MDTNQISSPRIAVLGAGISGLSAAAFLSKEMPDASVDIFDASDRVGGVIHTEYSDGLILEHAADNFATNLGHVEKLHQCLGIDPSINRPSEKYRFAQVVHRGKVDRIPIGFSLLQPTRLSSIMQSPVLSTLGKARLVAEQFVRARESLEDESLQSFATRRLGKEVFERLVEPIVCGIFTAKPDRLSMQAALPQYIKMERQHGSLIKAARAVRKKAREENPDADSARDATGARYDIFAAPVNGMSDWLIQIVKALPDNVDIRLQHRIESLKRTEQNKWRLDIRVGRAFQDVLSAEYDACIIALNAPQAASVLREVSSTAADELGEIEYASSAVAVFGFRKSELQEHLRCFGIVVPNIENRKVLAISLTSLKYPGRCNDDVVFARVFMGGAIRPDLYSLTDDELIQIGWNEARSILQLSSEEPLWKRMVRWPNSMPQYAVGHLEKLAKVKVAMQDLPMLQLCGNAYQGVGIPQCVNSGREAALKITESFAAGNV